MKTVLVVAAHSDDEAIGCAGTIAKHVNSGDSVHIIFMTNGVSSRLSQGNSEVKRIHSSQRSAELLGVTSIQQFDFPDNSMDSVPLLSVAKVVEKAVDEIKPEVVYTHHIGDLNIDHQITHKAVMTACRPQPKFCVKEIYAFEVLSSTEWNTPEYLPFTPNVFADISDYIGLKKQALTVYEEEMRDAPHSRSIINIMRLAAVRGNSVGKAYAEAFMAIRVTR